MKETWVRKNIATYFLNISFISIFTIWQKVKDFLSVNWYVASYRISMCTRKAFFAEECFWCYFVQFSICGIRNHPYQQELYFASNLYYYVKNICLRISNFIQNTYITLSFNHNFFFSLFKDVFNCFNLFNHYY